MKIFATLMTFLLTMNPVIEVQVKNEIKRIKTAPKKDRQLQDFNIQTLIEFLVIIICMLLFLS